MINNKTLNKYMTSATDNEIVEKADNKEVLTDVFVRLQELDRELDEMKAEATQNTDNTPLDLGSAILQIKADAESGNERAIDTLNKINAALNL